MTIGEFKKLARHMREAQKMYFHLLKSGAATSVLVEALDRSNALEACFDRALEESVAGGKHAHVMSSEESARKTRETLELFKGASQTSAKPGHAQ